MGKFDKAFQVFNEWIATYIVGSILLVLMFYSTGNVIGRYLFRAPLTGMIEYGGMLMIPLTFFSLANGWFIKGTFVTVNIIQNKLKGKVLWWSQFVIYLWSLLVWGGGLLMGTFFSMLESYRVRDTVGTPGAETLAWPWKAMMVIGLVLFCMRVSLDLITMSRTGKPIPFNRKAIGVTAAR